MRFGESTTDVVFAGNGLIYENGTLLAGSERFSFEEQVVISEIDVEHIRTERRVNTTFAACRANCAPEVPVRVSTEYVNSKDLNLTRVSIRIRLFLKEQRWTSVVRRYSPYRCRDWRNVCCIPMPRVRW